MKLHTQVINKCCHSYILQLKDGFTFSFKSLCQNSPHMPIGTLKASLFAVIVPKAILMEEIRNKTRSLVCLKMTSEVDLEPM